MSGVLSYTPITGFMNWLTVQKRYWLILTFALLNLLYHERLFQPRLQAFRSYTSSHKSRQDDQEDIQELRETFQMEPKDMDSSTGSRQEHSCLRLATNDCCWIFPSVQGSFLPFRSRLYLCECLSRGGRRLQKNVNVIISQETSQIHDVLHVVHACCFYHAVLPPKNLISHIFYRYYSSNKPNLVHAYYTTVYIKKQAHISNLAIKALLEYGTIYFHVI